MSPDTIGCVRTGEFYSYALRVDGEIFQCDKKKLRIEKYQVTCGRGLKNLNRWEFAVAICGIQERDLHIQGLVSLETKLHISET